MYRGGMAHALKAERKALDDEGLAAIVSFSLKVNRIAATISPYDIQSVLDAGWNE